MKYLLGLLLLSLSTSASAESLKLAASVADEELAEEAITLLHCLSEKTNLPWEFTGETSGHYWLKVRESGHELQGTYHTGEEEKSFVMKSGESEMICERLVPKAEAEPISLAPPLRNSPAFPEPALSEKKNYWPWAIGLGVAAAAGFFILKRSAPEHRALQMN